MTSKTPKIDQPKNTTNPNMSFPQMFQMAYTQQHTTNQELSRCNQLNQKSQEKQTNILLELLRNQVDVDQKMNQIDCKVDGQGVSLGKLDKKVDENKKELNGLSEKVVEVLKVVKKMEKKSKVDPKVDPKPSQPVLSYEFCKPDETCELKRKRITYSRRQLAEMSKCLIEFNAGKKLEDFVKVVFFSIFDQIATPISFWELFYLYENHFPL